MKKKIIGSMVVAITAITAFNINLNVVENNSSHFYLSNIEALAACEERIQKDGPFITAIVCNKTTSWLDDLRNLPCNTEKKDNECKISNRFPK